MTASNAALSGGPPAPTTAATSLKYCAPMSGESTIRARAVSANGFENAWTSPLGVRIVWPTVRSRVSAPTL